MRTARRRSAIPLIALALAAGVSAATGPVLWLSKKASGTATADANAGAVSADGHWAAFSSLEPLVVDDLNGLPDVYLRNLDTGALTLVSHVAGGTNGGDGVSDPASDPNNYVAIDLSVDGRFVVYDSNATNLVSGVTDANGGTDVFRYDRTTDSNEVVSLKDLANTRDDRSVNPHVSGDGQLVAFGSDLKVFVRNMLSGETTRVDVDTTGGEPDNFSERPDISADGRFVTFVSPASDLVAGDGNGFSDVFRRDLVAGETVRVSVADDESEAEDSSNHPHISGDGSLIVFESNAMNLIATDSNANSDIFLRDLTAETTVRVSVGDNEGQTILANRHADVSADGSRVSFETVQDNIADPSLSNLGVQDVLVRDRTTGQTLLASVAPPGTAPIDADAELATVCGSGRFVVFRTRTTLLDPTDSGTTQDIYAKDLGPGGDTTPPTITFAETTATVGPDASGVAMVVVDGQIVRLPAERQVAVPAGKTIEVWDGSANHQSAIAPTPPGPPPSPTVALGGVGVRKKRAQVTFTVANGPVDGTISIEKKRKRRPSKLVVSEPFTGQNGEQTVTVAKRLKPGRYDLALTAAGQTLTASFRVR